MHLLELWLDLGGVLNIGDCFLACYGVAWVGVDRFVYCLGLGPEDLVDLESATDLVMIIMHATFLRTLEMSYLLCCVPT